jgi:DNA/RNA endonuclease YhcR with UshA esterase domain
MESQMVRAALAISVVGLLLLAYAGESLNPPRCSIAQITGGDLGKNVHFIGNITRTHIFSGGSMVLTVNDSSGGIEVYVPYDLAAARPDLKNAAEIEVVGAVEVYRGRLEVVVAVSGGLRVMR